MIDTTPSRSKSAETVSAMPAPIQSSDGVAEMFTKGATATAPARNGGGGAAGAAPGGGAAAAGACPAAAGGGARRTHETAAIGMVRKRTGMNLRPGRLHRRPRSG